MTSTLRYRFVAFTMRAVCLVIPALGPFTQAACSSTSASATGDDASCASCDGTRDGGARQDAAHLEDASHDGRSDSVRRGPDAAKVDAGGLSYMVGIKCNSHESAPATLEGWLDRPTDVAGTTITTTSYVGGTNQAYTDAKGALPLLEVSFPLLSIYGEQPAYTDLAEAAAGAYDATYESMSKDLASFPNPLLSARIGWELNGNWYAWSNGVGTNATYANYVGAFQHAAVMLKKHNPRVLIQWNVAWGQPDPTPYWPGAYDATTNPGGVDVISMDFYQANISHYNNGGAQSTWATAQSGGGAINLDWMVAFAAQKGVKIALSEYGAGGPSSNGLGSGAGLNDGTWTAASVAWIQAQPAGFFLFTDWSDDEPADDIVTPGSNPAEQAAWSSAWQRSHFAGTWWNGTPPPSAL